MSEKEEFDHENRIYVLEGTVNNIVSGKCTPHSVLDLEARIETLEKKVKYLDETQHTKTYDEIKRLIKRIEKLEAKSDE